MIGRKLASAAKQLLSSSFTHASLFHTSNTPEQAVKLGRLSAQRKSFASRTSNRIAAAAPPATRKAPPLGLAGEPEKLNSPKRKDGDDDPKPPRRAWRPPSRAKEDVEVEKKKKKRAPPGPIEFESLTAPTPVHSDVPFAFRHSYTEIPKVPAVGFQEKFSPFGPGRLDRVWDGQQAVSSSSLSSLFPPPSLSSSSTPSDNSVLNMKKSKYSFKGVRLINPSTPQLSSTRPRRVRSREEVLGEPLTPEEIKVFVENASKHKTRSQINMGRDGLTHNMLIEIQEHWKREPVTRIRCKGVCTVDMENVVFQLEDKTGGKIIEKMGGTLYLFRGRNFIFKDRPFIPPMLWKPHAPMYPKLITEAPGGLKVHQANALRKRGQKIMRLCILSKNAYYGDLVRHVREAFEDDELVRIDCKGLNKSDYKKIGAKLRDLVPCYLLSFDKEQIILWRGREWVSSSGESKSSNIDTNNSEETNGAIVQHVEDGGTDIQMVVDQCGELNSIKSCCNNACEEAEKSHYVANSSDYSVEVGNLCDSSDEDAESSGFSSSESESSAFLEESIEA